MTIQLTHPKFTLDEYRSLFDLGVFPEHRRVELINGELSEMSPIGSEHIRCILHLTRLLAGALGTRGFLSIQNSMRIGNSSEPQPDVLVVARMPDRGEPPHSIDAMLIIEVADSSLIYDRDVKAPLYAAAGIPEYWIVDVNHQRVIRHRQPSASGYQQVDVSGVGERLVAEQLPAIDIAVADIFA